MTRGLWCSMSGHDANVALVLGAAGHVSQLRLEGVFPTRIAFVRAVLESGLGDAYSERALSTQLRTFGTTMVRDVDLEPGVLYVSVYSDRRPPVRVDAVELSGVVRA